MKLLIRTKKEVDRRNLKNFLKQIDKTPKDKSYTYKDVFGEDPK